jgi:hypothetical protein
MGFIKEDCGSSLNQDPESNPGQVLGGLMGFIRHFRKATGRLIKTILNGHSSAGGEE